MNNPEAYNGYPNYQTWAVALWIDNEQSSSLYWEEQTAEVYKNAEPDEFTNKERMAVRNLAEVLKDEHEEAKPEIEPANVFSDLLNSALGKVDWYYLADNMITEYLAQDSPQAYTQAKQH